MQASERHGFEGEGFSYLKSPIWWGGVITRTGVVLYCCCCCLGMTDRSYHSGHWRNRQLRCICVRARHSGHASGRAECFDRVRPTLGPRMLM